MSAAAIRATILEIIADGPTTTEALYGALSRRGTPAAHSTIRRLCAELVRDGIAGERLVRTPRNRTGIAVWHLASESAERVEIAAALLRGDPRAAVSFGGMRRPRVA